MDFLKKLKEINKAKAQKQSRMVKETIDFLLKELPRQEVIGINIADGGIITLHFYKCSIRFGQTTKVTRPGLPDIIL